MRNLFQKSKKETQQSWSLDDVVLELSGTDNDGISGRFPVSVRDTCESAIVFGEPGSGKSSGVLATLLKAYFMKGYGAVILTVKPTDRQFYEDIINKAGRGNDLVIFNEESGLKIDPFEYELSRLSRGGGKLESLVELMDTLDSLNNSGGAGVEDQGFWQNSKKMLALSAYSLLHLSGEKISIENLKEIVVTANESEGIINQFRNHQNDLLDQGIPESEKLDIINEIEDMMDRNYLIRCIMKADDISFGNSDLRRVFKISSEYFLRLFIELGDKTRSSVIQHMLGQLSELNGSVINQCFTGGISDELRPEKTYTEGKIIILDFPVLSYGNVGKLAQGLYRLIFSQEILRRECDYSDAHRPVALIMDEVQLSLFPSFESGFVNVSRASRVSIVALTQNINSIRSVMGNSNPDIKAKNLLACYGMTILCSNSCADTNSFGSSKIGKTATDKTSKSTSRDSTTISKSSEDQYQVKPIEFMRLKRGGASKTVEAFVVKAGKTDWRGSNYIRAVFPQ